MTPEDLTPFALRTFDALKVKLPSEITTRLKCSRSIRRHGSANSVLLFNVWDKNQVGLFDPKYFSYCLGYDPIQRYSTTTWYLHLWINTIRIYQHSAQIRLALEDIVRKQCPSSFHPEINDQAVNVVIRCNDFSGRLEDVESYFLPLYEELVGTIHPYIMPIIDSFTYDLTPEQRNEVIKSREKLYLGPKHRLSAEEIRTYSRSIPPSWRLILLEKGKYRCANCGCVITMTNHHIDHIKPFSKGGLTILSNLQAWCSPCNLKKGNRTNN